MNVDLSYKTRMNIINEAKKFNLRHYLYTLISITLMWTLILDQSNLFLTIYSMINAVLVILSQHFGNRHYDRLYENAAIACYWCGLPSEVKSQRRHKDHVEIKHECLKCKRLQDQLDKAIKNSLV